MTQGEIVTQNLKAFLEKLGQECMSCYKYIAYVEGTQKLQVLFPDVVRDSIVWNELHRLSSAQLVMTVARFMDDDNTSVTIHGLVNTIQSQVKEINWKLEGAQSRVPELVKGLRAKIEKLSSTSAIKKHRDWILAHNDKNVALGKSTVDGIPYRDLKEIVATLDHVINEIWAELGDQMIIHHVIYEQVVTEFSHSASQSVYAYFADKENPREYRETQRGRKVISNIKSLRFEY